MRGSRVACLLSLAGIQTAAFGVFSGRVGFYHDDWTNLERLSSSGGFWPSVSLYARQLAERPVHMLHYPLLFAIGGFHPWRYQAVYLLLEIVQGWLFFAVAEDLSGDRAAAFIAAAVALLFPTHGATHHWLSSSAQTVSLDLALASLLLHSRWLSRRKTVLAAGALACYLLAVLNYESAALIFLVPVAWRSVERALAGERIPVSLQEGLSESLPFIGVLAVAVAWQRLGVVLISGLRNSRPVAPSLWHALFVFNRGALCMSALSARLCLRALPLAWRDFGAVGVLCAVAAGAAAAWRLPLKAPSASPRSHWASWTAAAVAGYFAGTVPYAMTSDYAPTVIGLMSRTTVVLGLAAGLAVAAVFVLGRGARFPAVTRGVLGSVFTAFFLTDWHISRSYVRSWDLQQDILSRMAPAVAALPSGATVLAAGFPTYLDPMTADAIVFDAHWDICSALRLKSGRSDLHADVVSAGTRFGSDSVLKEPGNASYFYRNLYLYRYDRDAVVPLPGPGDAVRFLGGAQLR